jgi:hypothetical protein
MSPAATSLYFVAPKPLRKIARWPPYLTETRRPPARQSHQYRYPIHHFRGRERDSTRWCPAEPNRPGDQEEKRRACGTPAHLAQQPGRQAQPDAENGRPRLPQVTSQGQKDGGYGGQQDATRRAY